MSTIVTLWKLDGSTQLSSTDTSITPDEMAKELTDLNIKVVKAYKGRAPVIVCQGSGCPTGQANFFDCEDVSRHQLWQAGQAGFEVYDTLTLSVANAVTERLMNDRPVPFPWHGTEKPTIAKPTFGPEVPFPLSKDRGKHKFKAVAGAIHHYLGRGTYKAHNIAGILTITATGVAPHLNTSVSLSQLPIMIYPPRYGLFFSDPEFTLPATRPFVVEATFHVSEWREFVIVLDADGLHAVPVENF